MAEEKTPEEIEDDNELHFLQSKEFQESFKKQVINDTWGNDLPMCYENDKGQIIYHYKNGKIDLIDKITESKILTAEDFIVQEIRNINPEWNYGDTNEEVFRSLWMFFDPTPAKHIIIKAIKKYTKYHVKKALKIIDDKNIKNGYPEDNIK